MVNNDVYYRVRLLVEERTFVHQRTTNTIYILCAFLTMLTLFLVGAVFLGYQNVDGTSPIFDTSIITCAASFLFGFFAVTISMKPPAENIEDYIETSEEILNGEEIIEKEIQLLKDTRLVGEIVNFMCILSISMLFLSVLITIHDSSGELFGTTGPLRGGMLLVGIVSVFPAYRCAKAMWKLRKHKGLVNDDDMED